MVERECQGALLLDPHTGSKRQAVLKVVDDMYNLEAPKRIRTFNQCTVKELLISISYCHFIIYMFDLSSSLRSLFNISCNTGLVVMNFLAFLVWEAFYLSFYFILFYFFKDFIYLFIFREGKGGRKRGRQTSMCGCLSLEPSTGDLAHNPVMCPDWELNQ